MNATIPAELAQSLGLVEEGQEMVIIVQAVNEDGSMDVVCEYPEGEEHPVAEEVIEEVAEEAAEPVRPAAPLAFAKVAKAVGKSVI